MVPTFDCQSKSDLVVEEGGPNLVNSHLMKWETYKNETHSQELPNQQILQTRHRNAGAKTAP